MDIAKIRKKAKEQEEKGQASREGRGERPAENESAGSPAALQEDADPVEEAAEEALPETPVGTGDNDIVAVEDETVLAPSPDKAGERGFSGEKEPEVEGDFLELLTFSISNEEFAFRVPEVEEIIRHQRITKVPTMPDYVRGITSLRGKIIPVLDLKKRLVLKEMGSGGAQKGANGKILILAGPKGLIGATIDRVLGVQRFPSGSVLPPPGHLSDDELRFIEGVVIIEKRFISVIRSYDALDIELT